MPPSSPIGVAAISSLREVASVIGSVLSLPSIRTALLPAPALQAEVAEQYRGQKEWNHRHGDRGAFSELSTRNGTLEAQSGHQVRRIHRPTAGQHVDELEVREREQHR